MNDWLAGALVQVTDAYEEQVTATAAGVASGMDKKAAKKVQSGLKKQKRKVREATGMADKERERYEALRETLGEVEVDTDFFGTEEVIRLDEVQ